MLVDGAQAVPHMKVDVQALDCDFYAFSGHKVYGPTGIGVLYGKAALLEAMPPYQGGGDMISSVTFEKTLLQQAALQIRSRHAGYCRRDRPGRGDSLRGTAWASTTSPRTSTNCSTYATESVSAIPGVRLIGTAKEKAGVLSFVIEDIHPHDIGTILDQEGIAIRTGHHCSQPVMERFDIPATARASFALYNTREEVDALVARHRKGAGGICLMSDLRDLYQDVILEHSKAPRNFRELAAANHKAEGFNPLCGDRFTVYLDLEGDSIRDISFQGSGCAISKASASMMTQSLKGKTKAEAEKLFGRFHDLVTGHDAVGRPSKPSSASSPFSPACPNFRCA